MTLRISNTAFEEVLEAIPAELVGWELEVISPFDWSTVWALVPHWREASFQKLLSDTGTGAFQVRADDESLRFPLPNGEIGTYADYGPIIRVKRDGLTKFEWLVEKIKKPRVTEDGGPGVFVISGNGVATILRTGLVLPEDFPSSNDTTREFNQPLMQTWVQLFNEAQLRGCFPHVDLTFSETLDTTGTAWPGAVKIEVNAGDNLLDLLNSWVSQMGYSWQMLPGYKLAVYPTYGNLRQDEVVFFQGMHQHKNDIDIDRSDLSNIVFSDVGDAAGVVYAQDSLSITQIGRREAWIDAGDTVDVSATQAFVNANLRLLKDPDEQYTIEVDHLSPGCRVFEDWDYGDTVGVEIGGWNDYGVVEPHRIVGISLGMTEDGKETCEIVLATKEEIRQPPVVEVKKQQDGKQGGKKTKKKPTKKKTSKKEAKQVVKTSMLNELADVEYTAPTNGDTLVWDAGDNRFESRQMTLDLLEDVSAGSPSVGDALVWNGTAWIPDTVSGSGGATTGDLAAAILGLTPNGFWALDESSGTSANNQGSDGVDGIITSMAALHQKPLLPGASYCMEFSGAGSWVQVPSGSYDTYTQWTICAVIWCRYNNGVIVATKYTGGNVNMVLASGAQGVAERINSGRYSGGSWGTIATSNNLMLEPHLIVATQSATVNQIWVDGRKSTAAVLAAGGAGSASELRIGQRWDGGDWYAGCMSDVAIWDHVLTDSEIKALATAALG